EPEADPDPQPASTLTAVPPAAEVAPASTAPVTEPTAPAAEPAHGSPPGPMGDDEPVSRSLLFRYLSGEHS
ncbi:MAG TPA: hypothetical protein VK988_11135, partial [Acidimicrobiales bacterium]|nr:hypothetical protein [Acidimicrobiales bacterium]